MGRLTFSHPTRQEATPHLRSQVFGLQINLVTASRDTTSGRGVGIVQAQLAGILTDYVPLVSRYFTTAAAAS